MKRRNLLSAVSIMALSGCLSDQSSILSDSETVLNGVYITNHLGEDKRIEIIVEDSDNVYIDDVVVAEAGEFREDEQGERRLYGGATIECRWPDSPKTYTAKARIEDTEEWTEIEPSGQYEKDCELFEFIIEDYGIDGTTRPCRGQANTCGYSDSE